MTLPPLNLTADEAAALLLAVRAASGRAPLARAADSALAKISTVLGASASSGARRWDQRLVVSRRSPQRIDTAVLEQALERHRLVSLDYADADGTRTRRDVEPAGLITGDGNWYLVGWCRLRQGYRGFRFDRIVAAELTDEVVPEHDLGSALRQDGNTGPGPRGKAPQADPREADWNHPAARTWSRRS
ncbi:MAG: WYL domain-containing protein [Propionibacteriales bacterium]|nr:WYL domain-containing protein [Propionibacteriales bacterium]